MTATAIEIHIPILPPSANDMNDYHKGRVHNSEAYDKWLRTMGLIVNRQKAGGIVGPYKLMIQAKRANKKADIDNLIKPTSDLLELCGVVANDCYCEFVSARWVTQGDGMTVRVEQAVTG